MSCMLIAYHTNHLENYFALLSGQFVLPNDFPSCFQAQSLLRNFDRLHSVLYSELSGELKKLRALVCISETKLKIHQKRYL